MESREGEWGVGRHGNTENRNNRDTDIVIYPDLQYIEWQFLKDSQNSSLARLNLWFTPSFPHEELYHRLSGSSVINRVKLKSPELLVVPKGLRLPCYRYNLAGYNFQPGKS